jgi:hypothetical protein
MEAILEALTDDGSFQFKNACVEALGGIGADGFTELIDAADDDCAAVQEVCIRAIYRVGREAHHDLAFDRLLTGAIDGSRPPSIRYHALTGAVGLRLKVAPKRQRKLAGRLIRLMATDQPPMVQQRAAWGLGHLQPLLHDALQSEALDALGDALRRYGDGCERPDAAYGWRPIGNAILRYGEAGHELLEQMRLTADDRWLAWIAYQVTHVPQVDGTMRLVDETQAIEVHEKYAPEFPGWRRW